MIIRLQAEGVITEPDEHGKRNVIPILMGSGSATIDPAKILG
jgi:hypothetical protein